MGRVRVARRYPTRLSPGTSLILYVVHAAHAVDTGPDTSEVRPDGGRHRADGRRSRDGLARGHHLHPRAAPPAAARRRRGAPTRQVRVAHRRRRAHAPPLPRRRQDEVGTPTRRKQGIRHGHGRRRHWRRGVRADPPPQHDGRGHKRYPRRREGAPTAREEGRNTPRDRVGAPPAVRPPQIRPPPTHRLPHRHEAPGGPLRPSHRPERRAHHRHAEPHHQPPRR